MRDVLGQPLLRPRLTRRLRDAVSQAVTVITAPAGYGKTVLLEQWASEHAGAPLVWVTLRADDDWPRAAARLAAGLPPAGETVLVLDAVDAPTDEGLARELADLVERAPASMHLVLVSRSRSLPALDRLHGRGDVAFLTAADLAFTRAEARALVRTVADCSLGEPALERLMTRTEGWPVGLEVAAIGLRDAPDVEASIDALAGDERHVAAFLVEEVLTKEDPSLRRFLAQTSVLDRLNGSLCDAVTGGDDGTLILRRLERSGVFTRRSPGSRDWFVYHGLFRDLLRRELRSSEFGSESVLLARAGEWHAAHDDPESAARYYIEAEAWNALIELSDFCAQRMLENGRAADVLHWLDAVPRTYAGDTMLPLRRAYLHTLLGETRHAAQVVHDFAVGDVPPGQRAVTDALRATWAFFDATPESAIRAADDALHVMEVIDPSELPNILGVTSPTSLAMMAGTSRARALWYLGQVAASRRALQAGITQRDAHPPWLSRTMSALALLEAWTGDFRAATRHARRASAVPGRVELLQYPAMLDARIALAHVWRERGHQPRAADLLDEADALASGRRGPVTAAILSAERALWHLAAGQAEDGLAELERCRAVGASSPPPPLVDAYLRAAEARLLLSLGDVVRAEAVVADSSMRSLCPELAAAWVQAAVVGHDIDEARARLEGWELDAEPRARRQHALWTAVVEFEGGDRRRAIRGVSGVVLAAEREGDIRLFLDGGRPVERLLRALVHSAQHPFAERVLRAAQRARAASSGDALGLSKRELEVARYLPTPLSSAEIAGQLYISLNTLKTHLRTIYGKLGATSRREAIQRAEDLGIA